MLTKIIFDYDFYKPWPCHSGDVAWRAVGPFPGDCDESLKSTRKTSFPSGAKGVTVAFA